MGTCFLDTSTLGDREYFCWSLLDKCGKQWRAVGCVINLGNCGLDLLGEKAYDKFGNLFNMKVLDTGFV